MKQFLLLLSTFFCLVFLQAQTYEINGQVYNGGSFSEPAGYSETFVRTTSTRLNSFTYHHQSPVFRVNFNEAWLTDLSPIFPEALGNNTDNFNYQGNNTISGENAVFFFDYLNFNIGQGNTMFLNNRNEAFHGDPDYYLGQPKGSIVIFRHWNSHDGITTTNRNYPVSGAMVFANNAGYSYPASVTNLSHVNGFVSEYNVEIDNVPRGHGGTFIFPVGDGSKAYPLQRQGTFEESGKTITVGWVNGNPNTTPDPTGNGQTNYTSTPFLESGILSITTIGFWDWHVQLEHDPFLPNPPFQATWLPHAQTITVTMPDFSHLPVNASDLRLVGYNPALSRWQNLSGGNGATGSSLSGIIPANTVITALAVGSITAVLPVEFAGFTATIRDCHTLLEWQTGMEQNNAHFLVERSNDGVRFDVIATIASKGNSSRLQSYVYKDMAPSYGVNHYRIRQVDFDGKNTATSIKTVRVQCDKQQGFKVYPNPAIGDIRIEIAKTVKQVNIIAINGKVVLSQVPAISGAGILRVPLMQLPAGIYIVQLLYNDGLTDTQKILKQ